MNPVQPHKNKFHPVVITLIDTLISLFFFSSRRRHTIFLPVSWARRCVYATDAVSPTLTAAEALSSLGMFFIIYALLLALFLYQITHKIRKGPDQETDEDDGAGEGKLQVPFVKD